jgi:hypothetical protein
MWKANSFHEGFALFGPEPYQVLHSNNNDDRPHSLRLAYLEKRQIYASCPR